MTRAISSLACARKLARQRRSGSRLLTSLLIVAAVAGNVASCRDFDLSDARASAGTSSAGTSSSGTSSAGTSSSGTSSAGIGGNNASSDTGGRLAAAGVSGGGDALQGGGGHGGVDTVTMAGSSGDGGTSGARATDNAVSPSALNGVVLWLEASEASFESNGSRVSKWKDSSEYGNDATEPDSPLQPLLVPNALNGLPVVKFDGTPSNLIVSDDASLQFGTESFTVAFVGEWHNSPTPKYTISGSAITFTYPGYGFILNKTLPTEPYDGIAISANIAAPFGTVDAQRRLGLQLEIGTAAVPSKANDLNDSRFRLYVVRRSAPGLIEQRINGTQQNSADIPPNIDASASGRSISIGGNIYNPLAGSLAELVMVKGALSERDLHGLELYLMSKFGL